MRYSVTKSFVFDAAHRLKGHKGKCCNIHGHTYKIEVTLALPTGWEVPADGMVADFGNIKSLLKHWLDSEWDHALILQKKDPLVRVLEKETKTYLLDDPPTAEVMAKFFFRVADEKISEAEKSLEGKYCGDPDIGPGVRVSKVRVYETAGSWADYEAQPTEVSLCFP